MPIDRAGERRRRAEEADGLLEQLLATACDALGLSAEGIAVVAVGLIVASLLTKRSAAAAQFGGRA